MKRAILLSLSLLFVMSFAPIEINKTFACSCMDGHDDGGDDEGSSEE